MTPRPDIDFDKLLNHLDTLDTIEHVGRVREVVGTHIKSSGPTARLGDCCVVLGQGREEVPCEVVGFRDEDMLLMPLSSMEGIGPGAKVRATGKPLTVPVGHALIGRVLDGLGRPLDGGPPVSGLAQRSIYAEAPHPLHRRRIEDPLTLGVKAVDALLTTGKGQRIGIFSGSGVGKSTLMGMMARNTSAEVNVIGLVGERGREVREFIEKDLGEEGLARSVVVVATGDQLPLVRVKGAYVATTIAEYFRDQGADVLLMMDSLTRFAMGLREVGLSVGEPPTTRGYTPTVFAAIPALLERAGTSEKGSITGIYTVLVEADDMNEPIADAARATLDGHLVLTRELAHRGHYPSLDILQSVSRVMNDITPRSQQIYAQKFKELLADFRRTEDLINIGAYVRGANPRVDVAVDKFPELESFLRQGVHERWRFQDSVQALTLALTGVV